MATFNSTTSLLEQLRESKTPGAIDDKSRVSILVNANVIKRAKAIDNLLVPFLVKLNRSQQDIASQAATFTRQVGFNSKN